MGTFKVKDAEDQARIILLDTYDDAYRFEPKEIYLALRDGLKHIRSIRPESRYLNGALTELNFPGIADSYDASTRASMRDADINMDDRWLEAAVFYTVYRMYLKDDADTQNANLAAQYLTMFNQSATT